MGLSGASNLYGFELFEMGTLTGRMGNCRANTSSEIGIIGGYLRRYPRDTNYQSKQVLVNLY